MVVRSIVGKPHAASALRFDPGPVRINSAAAIVVGDVLAACRLNFSGLQETLASYCPLLRLHLVRKVSAPAVETHLEDQKEYS